MTKYDKDFIGAWCAIVVGCCGNGPVWLNFLIGTLGSLLLLRTESRAPIQPTKGEGE